MCVYDGCPYSCLTKKQHHFRFARMRRNKPVEIVKIPSLKVNWDVVEKLKLNKPPSRKDENKLQ